MLSLFPLAFSHACLFHRFLGRQSFMCLFFSFLLFSFCGFLSEHSVSDNARAVRSPVLTRPLSCSRERGGARRAGSKPPFTALATAAQVHLKKNHDLCRDCGSMGLTSQRTHAQCIFCLCHAMPCTDFVYGAACLRLSCQCVVSGADVVHGAARRRVSAR